MMQEDNINQQNQQKTDISQKTPNVSTNIMPETEAAAPAASENLKDVIKEDPKKTSPPIKGKSNFFKSFLIISVIFIIAIYSGVYYLYTQNQKIKSSLNTNIQTSPTATPTPLLSPEQFRVDNGNVIRQTYPGEKELLIDKEYYPNTGIAGFSKIEVSPSLKNICLESIPPSPKPAIYLSDIGGANVKEISQNKENCIWPDSSDMIYYLNLSSKSTAVNIYSYDLEQKTELNITKDSIPQGVVRQYKIIGFSSDGTKLICSYSDISSGDNMSKDCEIDLSKNTVNFL